MDEVETLIKNRELIDDIDKDDVENPQLVVEYVNEIYAYLRQLEVKQEIRPNYLKSKKVDIGAAKDEATAYYDQLLNNAKNDPL